MNPIHWLEVLKSAKHIKYLSNHFILKAENKFMVFTSKPVNGVNNRIISTTNIEGEQKAQYICEKIHSVDPTTTVIKTTQKGVDFYSKHQEKLQLLIEKMQPIIEKLS